MTKSGGRRTAYKLLFNVSEREYEHGSDEKPAVRELVRNLERCLYHCISYL